MPATSTELMAAKEATAILLEQIGLEAYLFEIEPRDGRWQLKVDCAIEDGWQAVTLAVDKGLLLASRTDAAARRQLLAQWQVRLSECKVTQGSGYARNPSDD